MIEEILMGLGAVVGTVGILTWTAGEMYAVDKGEDTTTSYVRRARRKSRLVRVGVGGFTSGCVLFFSWLWLHFNLGWW